MRRLLALAGLLALVRAGCGVRPSGAISGDPAPTGPVNGVTLFFVRNGELAPTLRTTATALPRPRRSASWSPDPASRNASRACTPRWQTTVGPVTVTTTDGITVDLAVDPNSLSTMAIDQLACIAQSAVADQTTPVSGPPGLAIAGAGKTIRPRGCP
jgi:hypothetical protein